MLSARVFALILALAVASALQAAAQSTPKRRVFAEADYAAYFSAGDFRTESPTFRSVSSDQRRGSQGKQTISFVEAMPKFDRTSLYPFVKVKGATGRRVGKFDPRRQLSIETLSDADFEAFGKSEVWLSNNKTPIISPDDVRIGALIGYYRLIARKTGLDPDSFEAGYRRSYTGQWTVRCEFVDGPGYEVECAEESLKTREINIRRYLKQAGMS